MANDTLGAEVLEHAEAGMPQLDVSIFPNLIFWLIVSIVLLYLILSRVAIPRITSVLAERSDAISSDLEQAQLYKRRAEEAEAAYNAALAKAREEAQKIAADTKAQVGKETAVLLAKADAEIAAKAAESEARIGEIRESAARSVEEVAKETAAEIVAAILPGKKTDAAAVDSAVSSRLKG
ncbi:MAG: F0F1 ATP synthase subunit B' [Rhodobacteraceae bacterium]|nr:F0F1 ATP synthase subunit B' [Paracoccaceae bacterium]